jgi:hypothetical protein
MSATSFWVAWNLTDSASPAEPPARAGPPTVERKWAYPTSLFVFLFEELTVDLVLVFLVERVERVFFRLAI